MYFCLGVRFRRQHWLFLFACLLILVIILSVYLPIVTRGPDLQVPSYSWSSGTFIFLIFRYLHFLIFSYLHFLIFRYLYILISRYLYNLDLRVFLYSWSLGIFILLISGYIYILDLRLSLYSWSLVIFEAYL